MEGALFSSNTHDHSLEALNSKLALSTPQYLTSKINEQNKSLYEHSRKLPFCNSISRDDLTSGSGCVRNYNERNVFAINVSYYVKIKISLSSIGGDVSLKLPFFLGNVEAENISIDQSSSNLLQRNLNYLKSDEISNNDSIKRDEIEKVNSTLERSSNSSASDIDLKLSAKQENVVQVQIHERKYLESDI